MRPEPGHILATIPRLSTEWSVELYMRFFVFPVEWTNILHLTNGSFRKEFGERIPAIFFRSKCNCLRISSSVNNSIYFMDSDRIYENQTYFLDIQQRYISNGQYRFFVNINNIEVNSMTNTNAMQFYNVKMYLNGVNNQRPSVDIWNIKHTNFL